jgi:ABC-type lipoprotein release transport system permease subunit
LLSLNAIRAIFDDQTSMGDVLIKLRPGANAAAAEEGVARATDGKIDHLEEPLTPADLVSFGGQRNLPFVLAAILALMAVLTIGHALVSSINRRRRDIAILKATGFTPQQARLTIAWQATTLMVVGVAFGLPIGIAVGRALWTTYAHSLGIIAEPRPPFSWLLLTVPAALVLSNLIAMMPARRAARLEPAIVLRTE